MNYCINCGNVVIRHAMDHVTELRQTECNTLMQICAKKRVLSAVQRMFDDAAHGLLFVSGQCIHMMSDIVALNPWLNLQAPHIDYLLKADP
jgi:hypothetical protein